jgi:hypothetical protein
MTEKRKKYRAVDDDGHDHILVATDAKQAAISLLKKKKIAVCYIEGIVDGDEHSYIGYCEACSDPISEDSNDYEYHHEDSIYFCGTCAAEVPNDKE